MYNRSGLDQVFVISRSGSGQVLKFNITFGLLSKKSELEIWKPIRGLREFSCVSFKHYIFILGGYSVILKRCVEYVKRYDVITNEWTDLPSMGIERRLCSAVVFKGEIIICGGFRTNNKLLNTTEIFNIKRRKWRKCSNLKKAKADQQLIVIEDSVIGVGGVQQVLYNGETVFCASDEIVEYKDMVSGWLTLDENLPLILGKPVYLHSIAATESKIYIIGGLKTVINNSGELSEVINENVESLFLGKNSFASCNKKTFTEWISPWDRSISSPSIFRYGAAAIMMGHDIYLIGGIAENYPNGVFTVERFHSKMSSWTKEFDIVQEMDLSLVSAIKVYGSKYIISNRKEKASPTIISTYVISDENEEEKDIEVRKHYRVGWVLW